MNLAKKFNRRNYWMVVNVRAKDLKVPIIIPCPLWLAEDIVISLIQLTKILIRFIPKMRKHTFKWGSGSYQIDILDILEIPVELILELRKLGRFTLVEVHDEDAHVSIKFF